MKKSLLFLVVLFLSHQLIYSQTNPQYLYKLDVKTKLANKKELEPLKNGLIAKIENSIYFKKVEFGENYSLWIKDPVVKKEMQSDGSKKVHYYCLLELRTPAAFSNGKYVTSRAVNVDYEVSKEILDKMADPDYKNLGVLVADIGKNMMNSSLVKSATNGAIVHTAGISLLAEKSINETINMMSNYFQPNDPLDFKAEYIFVGTELYNNLIEMIVDLENK